ncbi:MAG: hypothetical protein IT462_16205 [Planctomycetes bacterium]|nr:hypothetical protein [Planctomycetota bacterium]
MGLPNRVALTMGVLFILGCLASCAPPIPPPSDSWSIPAGAKLTLRWYVYPQPLPPDHIRRRDCTPDEEAALRFLVTLPHYEDLETNATKIEVISDSIDNWFYVDDVKWCIQGPYVFPESGSRGKHFTTEKGVRVGWLRDNGDLSLDELVRWHKSKTGK